MSKNLERRSFLEELVQDHIESVIRGNDGFRLPRIANFDTKVQRH